MFDEVSQLSQELARQPGSLVFLRLGEALRRRGQLELALRVSLRGLERHAGNSDAHDLVARIYADLGEFDRALQSWDAVLQLAPRHPGARKGKGFVLFKQGRWSEAESELLAVTEQGGEDPSISAALAVVRQHASEVAVRDSDPHVAQDPGHRPLFADALGEGEMTALLIDSGGLVMAGTYPTVGGGDVSQEIGAELRGVSDEVQRAMRHLELGSWTCISFETDAATVAMAPAGDGGLVLLAADTALPQGMVRRVLELCAVEARTWLERNISGAGA